MSDDTQFNESYATAVERIGVALWLAQHGDGASRTAYARLQQMRREFRELTSRTREALDTIYRSSASDDDKRHAKLQALERMRSEYATLKQQRWDGFAGYDAWFANANNAALGLQAAYNDLAGDFERLYVQQGRDVERFYAEAARIAALPKGERHATLRAIP